MNLCQLFDLSLRGRKDAIALEFQGREYSFGDLDSRKATASRKSSWPVASAPVTDSASTWRTASK